MKKFLKIIGILFVVLIVLLTAGYIYLQKALPNVGPAPDMKISASPEMLERGKYLAEGPAACIDCHSTRDYSRFAGPITPGTEGKGGFDFGEGAGFVPAANITSDKETGIGSWTDGEIYRAVTMGVDKSGEPLAPMMPYTAFAHLDENDIKSIIAYIRTLPPIKNKVPPKELDFPLSIIVRTIPEKPQFTKLPDPKDKIATGKYYAAACMICHTKMEKGKFDMDKQFAGGNQFEVPSGGYVTTANITPDAETGIGSWSKEQFIAKFRSFKDPAALHPVKQGEFNTVMPWTFLANMSDDDLGAVYEYLRTVPPVKNKIEKFAEIKY
jgi:mono/diheme cytochrome c family protein